MVVVYNIIFNLLKSNK